MRSQRSKHRHLRERLLAAHRAQAPFGSGIPSLPLGHNPTVELGCHLIDESALGTAYNRRVSAQRSATGDRNSRSAFVQREPENRCDMSNRLR